VLRVYQFISQLHENPRLIGFASTRAGQFLVWLTATFLLSTNRRVAILVSPILGLLFLFPARRKTILALGALVAFFKIASDRGLAEPLPLAIGFAIVLVSSYCYFMLASRYRNLPGIVQRYPMAIAHLPTLILIGVLWCRWVGVGPQGLSPPLAAALSLLPFLMWRWSYLLFSGRRGHVEGTRFSDHIVYLLPPFGGSNVPFGKGRDYLSSHQSDDQYAAARSQLAGLKLLVLVILWRFVKRMLEAAAYGTHNAKINYFLGGWDMGLVPLATQLASDSPGDVSLTMGLAMILLSLFEHVLLIAIFGHLIIGCLRLFGFNVFRNTYKPLLAESLVEYWNRFYYYFKELLVEFFFYPTFIAAARLPATMRIFVSIMAAAFLGNFYYHFIRDMRLYLESPGEDIIAMLLPWLLYGFMLGIGIFVSMMREKKRRCKKPPRRSTGIRALVRVRRILGVWSFYGFLLIWIAGPPSITFGKRFEFLLALLAIH
jgi:hypothetical protein